MSQQLSDFDKHMSAITFAEAGEHEAAKEMIIGQSESTVHVTAVSRKSKPYLGTLFFGICSLSAYIFLLTNQKLVTDTFTMGGWHAVFPVGTAFLFSFIHGAFASKLLSVIGIEAKK
jgi:uncharacterized integral membrane protein